MTYNANGQQIFTAVTGTSRTGIQNINGSTNVVLTTENTTWKGSQHPCGAYWGTVVTSGTSVYAIDGSLNIISNGDGTYSPLFGRGGNIVFPAIPFGTSVVLTGDSITANGYSITSTLSESTVQAFDNWALMFAGQPLRFIVNSIQAVGGQTSTTWIGTYAANVIAQNPSTVRILIGTNDLTTIPAATTISNIQSALNQNAAIGARTILVKILPRGSIAVPMNSTQLTAWLAVNAWIATQNSPTVLVLDLEAAIGAMDANHTLLPQFSDDVPALHPNQLGAFALGLLEQQLLTPYFSAGSILDTTNAAAGNYVTNGFFTGTSGAIANATGVMATNWVGQGSSAGGSTIVYSQVARSGGLGNWQQVVASGTYTGTGKQARITAGIVGLNLNVGDILQFVCEVQIDANPTNVISFFSSVVTSANDTVAVNFHQAQMAPTSSAWNGVMQSIPFVLSANATTLSVTIGALLADSAGTSNVAASMRVGRFAIRKLN